MRLSQKLNSRAAIGVLSVTALFIVLWLRGVHVAETPLRQTFRLCRACGLATHEVEWLIQVHRNTTLRRQESIDEILAGAYADPSGFRGPTNECTQCIEGILDEAGLE